MMIYDILNWQISDMYSMMMMRKIEKMLEVILKIYN